MGSKVDLYVYLMWAKKPVVMLLSTTNADVMRTNFGHVYTVMELAECGAATETIQLFNHRRLFTGGVF